MESPFKQHIFSLAFGLGLMLAAPAAMAQDHRSFQQGAPHGGGGQAPQGGGFHGAPGGAQPFRSGGFPGGGSNPGGGAPSGGFRAAPQAVRTPPQAQPQIQGQTNVFRGGGAPPGSNFRGGSGGAPPAQTFRGGIQANNGFRGGGNPGFQGGYQGGYRGGGHDGGDRHWDHDHGGGRWSGGVYIGPGYDGYGYGYGGYPPDYGYGYSDAYADPYYADPNAAAPYVPADVPPDAAVVPDDSDPSQQPVDQSNCRDYQSTVIVNGQPQPANGVACLQPDGSWRIVQ